jgi:hypothetical protein
MVGLLPHLANRRFARETVVNEANDPLPTASVRLSIKLRFIRPGHKKARSDDTVDVPRRA